MVTTDERRLCQSLRDVLAPLNAEEAIPQSEQFREVLSDLEYFVPSLLVELHPEWQSIALDGIVPLFARKTANNAAEILGHCILISDQTLTPIHLRMQIAETEDEISWLECRVGQRGMQRVPYERMVEASKVLYAMNSPIDEMDWVYRVVFGEPRRS